MHKGKIIILAVMMRNAAIRTGIFCVTLASSVVPLKYIIVYHCVAFSLGLIFHTTDHMEVAYNDQGTDGEV